MKGDCWDFWTDTVGGRRGRTESLSALVYDVIVEKKNASGTTSLTSVTLLNWMHQNKTGVLIEKALEIDVKTWRQVSFLCTPAAAGVGCL